MKRKTHVRTRLHPLHSKMSFISNDTSGKIATFIDFSDFVSSLKSKPPSQIVGKPMKRLKFDRSAYGDITPEFSIENSNKSLFSDEIVAAEKSSIETSDEDFNSAPPMSDSFWTSVKSLPSFTSFFKTYLVEYSKRKCSLINSTACDETREKMGANVTQLNKVLLGSRLWSDQYAPLAPSGLCLNCPDLHSLISWMKFWNSRAEGVSQPDASENCYSSSNDDSSDSSSSRHWWRSTAYLLLGPTGCGKTTLVYALANENGFKVFEMNSSACRSRKEVLSQCSAVVSSQHVSKDSLSASFSSFQMTKVNAGKIAKRKSSKRSILNFFQPVRKSTSSSKKRTKKSSTNAEKGLTLSNKSLLLFDEVDVLFESDRGFWNAVSDLLRLAQRPIIMTASDPTVIHRIPINFHVCRLLPTRTEVVKPLLSSICDLVHFDASTFLQAFISNLQTKISSVCDAISANTHSVSTIISRSQFPDLRRAVNELQWISVADSFHRPSNHVRSGADDPVGFYSEEYPQLFSLTLKRCALDSSVKMRSNPIVIDVFDGIFDSEPQSLAPSPAKEDRFDKPQFDGFAINKCCDSAVYLPLKDCELLTSDCLHFLSRVMDSASMLDSYSTRALKRDRTSALQIANDFFLVNALSQSGLDKESNDNHSYPSPVSTTCSLCVDLSFAEGCSECPSGVNGFLSSKALPCETFWRKTMDLMARRQLNKFETRLVSFQSNDSDVSSAHLSVKNPTSLGSAVDIASGALFRLNAMMNNALLFQSSIPKRDFAIDYLPSLSRLTNLETIRQGLSEQRRFLHYFDKIGLCLSDDLRRSL